MSKTSEGSFSDLKWHHPSEVMKLHKLKKKKKALQARIKNETNTHFVTSKFDDIFSAGKRKNPFLRNTDSKRTKIDTSPILEESTDQTLFKLLNQSSSASGNQIINFTNILNVTNEQASSIELVKAQGEKCIPIDWSLKNKMRLLSSKPFLWNQKLKISEEASGITAFTRCLDNNTETTLDISPNAKFYQCCLYWQQPTLPWLTLFPRNSNKLQMSTNGFTINSLMKESLQKAWSDSLRSLFQLIRTGQCPYFYVCANNFTILFRAAGISGFSDPHVIITPTTRGFRKLLTQEDIEYKLPLKSSKKIEDYEFLDSLVEEENEGDTTDENWLKNLGVNDTDIKHISSTQVNIFLYLYYIHVLYIFYNLTIFKW